MPGIRRTPSRKLTAIGASDVFASELDEATRIPPHTVMAVGIIGSVFVMLSLGGSEAHGLQEIEAVDDEIEACRRLVRSRASSRVAASDTSERHMAQAPVWNLLELQADGIYVRK